MTETRAYVSSSYPDLVDYRDAARRLLSQHHIDDRGMEDADYVANPSLYEKCITDAAAANLVLLIVGYRYGTRLPQHAGKSLVELEYQAATDAGRDVRAFLLTDQPLPEADDRRGPDGGAAIERFRRRLIDDGRHVAYVNDLADFERKCDKLLIEYRKKLLDQRESDPVVAVANREQMLLETYARDVIERNRMLETFYVPLAATTKVVPTSPPWHDELFGDTPMKTAQEPLEIELDHVVNALRTHDRFYLVAEPGGGKSLSLIAMETAAAKLYLTNRRWLPLRLDISPWTAGQEFGTFLEQQLNERTKVAVLPSSQLLLLLDGVIDSAAAPFDPLEKIEAWLRQNERCHAVLAVRTHRAFSRQLPVVRIAPLDESRIRQFVDLRLKSDPARAATLFARLGLGASNRRSDRLLATFTSNPFNLSLICDLDLQERLPSSAVALLHAVVAFKHAKESKNRPHVAWDSFADAIGAVAIAMIRNRAHLAADAAWLRKVLPADESVPELLDLAKDCQVMIAHSGGARYEFRHRLYLEYFAAERLRRHPEMLDDVLEEPSYIDGRRHPRKFDEVLEALVQLDGDARIIETIAAYDPLLGARCLRLLKADEDSHGRAVSAVVNGLGLLFTDADARDEAIAKLAGFGASAVTVLRRLMKDNRHFIRRSAVRALSQIRDLQAIEAVVLALRDTNRWVRDDAQSTIRRFDATFRALLLQCIRSRITTWLDDPATEGVVDALAILIDDLPAVQHEFGLAISEAAGIDLARTEEPAAETIAESLEDRADVTREDAVEAQDELAAAEDEVVSEAAVSWGRRWAEEWEEDRGNPALAAAGRTWLRSTSTRDFSWSFVWSMLWDARTGPDADLEWLARDWLARTPVRAKPWAHVWQRLFRELGDQRLAQIGYTWLMDPRIGSEQFGWTFVWRALWEADWKRDDLVRRGFWWLDATASSFPETWSIVWMRLWDARIDRKRLDEIGRSWVERAEPSQLSWGFIWPRLWAAAPGDPALLARANEWLQTASFDNAAWSYIWSRIAVDRRLEPATEERAWKFVRDQPLLHPAWIHVWEPLWKRHKRDPELSRLGREWLASVSPSHGAWTPIWEVLWEVAKGDAELTAIGREWIRKRGAKGARTVCVHLLAHAHGDQELLAVARAAFLEVFDDNRYGGFPTLWRVQWDAEGDRQWLEPLGRDWVTGAGLGCSSFQSVWQPLWRMHPGDLELQRAVVASARSRAQTSTPAAIQDVASLLLEALKARPADSELLAVAREILQFAPRSDKEGSAWATLWRLQWEFGGEREWLGPIGREWLRGEGMKSNGFSPVWQRLWADRAIDPDVAVATTTDLKSIAIGWMKVTMGETRWTTIAELLMKADPHDGEVLAMANEIVSDVSSVNWATAWQILGDAGMWNDELLSRGVEWVESKNPQYKHWAVVWRRLPATLPQTQIIARAWELMEPSAYGHRFWPDIWRNLWERDPLQRPRLAQIAADWGVNVHEDVAERIWPWDEIEELVIGDPDRRAAVARVLERLRSRRPDVAANDTPPPPSSAEDAPRTPTPRGRAATA